MFVMRLEGMKCAVLTHISIRINAGLTLMSCIQYTCGSKNFQVYITKLQIFGGLRA